LSIFCNNSSLFQNVPYIPAPEYSIPAIDFCAIIAVAKDARFGYILTDSPPSIILLCEEKWGLRAIPVALKEVNTSEINLLLVK
jgi:hypothetical protein